VPQIAVIADDLTGAADTGAMFAAAGLTTLVVFKSGPHFAADVLIVSTHSRHLVQGEAAAQTSAAVAQLFDIGAPDWLYKKIDSTLRGHPGAELAALMQVAVDARALIAPAFPAQGRTTVNGRQLVDGQPLEDTPFSAEVATSEVAAFFGEVTPGRKIYSLGLDVIRAGADRVRQMLTAEVDGLFVADAETDSDLRCLVEAARDSDLRLLCGSAGLARALQEVLVPQSTVKLPTLPSTYVGPVLVVAGSQNAHTARQIELAAGKGIQVIRLDGAGAGDMWDGEVDVMIEHLSTGRNVVLTTAGADLTPLAPQQIAARLGDLARKVLKKFTVGGLVLTGGDIAMATCTALDSTALWLEQEVEPGIPQGRLADGPWSGLPIVTKAGGFGTDQALIKAVHYLAPPLNPRTVHTNYTN
jgi:uncharacterized protein YgbK (DUF1537 family)